MTMERPNNVQEEEHCIDGLEIPIIRIERYEDQRNDKRSIEHTTKDESEDGAVTLRRQNVSLDNLSAFTDDDYKFSEFNLDPHFRSRKKTEIGSEKMISNDVSLSLCMTN